MGVLAMLHVTGTTIARIATSRTRICEAAFHSGATAIPVWNAPHEDPHTSRWRAVCSRSLPMRAHVIRAIGIALVVGTVLVLINHADHLADEPTCERFYLKVALTYLTPAVVSLVTARLATRVSHNMEH